MSKIGEALRALTNSCDKVTLDKVLSPDSKSSYIVTAEISAPLLSLTNTNITESLLRTEAELLEKFRSDDNPDIEFPPKSAATERTYIILEAFLIIDALWIIAAIALLIGVLFRIKNNLSIIFFFPWTAVLLVILFFDGVTAAWYGIDIGHTSDLPSWLNFIGVRNHTNLDKVKSDYPNVQPTLPSILMMLVFGRFFVIWLINLFLFFRVVQAAVNAADDFDDQASLESKHPHQGHSGATGVNNQRPRDFQVREVNPNSAKARIRRWQLYYGTDDEEDEKEMREVRHPPRRASKQKQAGDDEGWQKDDAFRYDQASGSGLKLAVIGGYEGDRSESPSPLPHSDGRPIRNPHNNYYSSGYESNDVHFSFEQHHQEASSRTSPDYAEVYYEGEKAHQVCVGELRGQLPWSYFRDRNDLDVPKGRRYDDTLPPVPVPDYTLRFNQKDTKRNIPLE